MGIVQFIMSKESLEMLHLTVEENRKAAASMGMDLEGTEIGKSLDALEFDLEHNVEEIPEGEGEDQFTLTVSTEESFALIIYLGTMDGNTVTPAQESVHNGNQTIH